MTYYRYVITSADGAALHGNFHRVQQIWGNVDGSALFRVECDDVQFQSLAALRGVTVLPSLNAPADRLSSAAAAYFAAEGVTAAAGDTVLNMLRKVRALKPGASGVMIDNSL